MSEGCQYIMKQGPKKGYPCGFPCRGDFCFKHKNEELSNNKKFDIVESLSNDESDSDSNSEEFVIKQNKKQKSKKRVIKPKIDNTQLFQLQNEISQLKLLMQKQIKKSKKKANIKEQINQAVQPIQVTQPIQAPHPIIQEEKISDHIKKKILNF